MKVYQIGKNKIGVFDDENRGFTIFWTAADLYWLFEDYYDDNEFIISKEDGELFLEFQNLFKIIKQHDNEHKPVLNENTFNWGSESYSYMEGEDKNKLMITEEQEKYIIHFMKNPKERCDPPPAYRNCSICFCLSGSRNQKIANAFSIMLHNLKDNPILEKVKKLEKNI